MTGAVSVERLQQLQNEILEMIACGGALKAIGEVVCERAESLAPGIVCSILCVDANGRLRPLAGPSLPESYSDALDGIAIGPKTGSCGTAAFRGEPVEVADIASDPLWADYKNLALPLGLEACWSSPIKARDGRVVGTFAFYYREKRGPAELERRIVEKCVHVCAIAIEHEEATACIHRLAYFDTLTGLPNREQFQDRAAALLAAAAGAAHVNVLYVDLDDFKSVNDTLGHRVGDLLLEAVARRLCACVDDSAFLARLGGDEFAIVQTTVTGRGAACSLAERIVGVLDEPFELDDQKVTMGASVGIAHTEPGGADLEELSRRADMALYAAKRDGGGTYRFFSAEIDAAMQLRSELKHDVKNALDAGEFKVVYQPIVAFESSRIVAAEALLRWDHPLRGRVAPSEFIPVAEEIGVIDTLGEWALNEACAAAAEWPLDIRVAVNLSPLQLKLPGLVLDVIDALNRNGIAPSRLDLEITESALLAENAVTRVALHELHAAGIRLALDDFGTGYSSLRSLRAFPVDKIKIDQSFVRDIGRNADSAAIIRAVIGLANDLGLSVAAEGIETAAHREWLALQGCTEGQGHYFSEPLTREDLRASLESHESAPLSAPRNGTKPA